jgi:hypothetical protein
MAVMAAVLYLKDQATKFIFRFIHSIIQRNTTIILKKMCLKLINILLKLK